MCVCVCRESRAEDSAHNTVWGSYVQGDGVGGELAYFHHLRSAGEEGEQVPTESIKKTH